jgi:hypothetical protein
MFSEHRRKPRKSINALGFIYTVEGRPIGECSTLDISETGAKLKWACAGELPPEFLLSLSRNGKVRRRCHLRWQEADKIGVRFILE